MIRLRSCFSRPIFKLAVLFLVAFISYQKSFAATLTLTPATGVAGQEIIITGSGFDNSSAVTFTIDGQALTTNPVSVTTSGAGALPPVATQPVSFIIPSLPFGTHVIRASTSAVNIGLATLTINTPAVAVGSPTVPTAGLPVGLPIVVTGTNFEANQTTTIYFDNVSMGTTTSTVSGAFEFGFSIPDVNNTGAHIIKASNSQYAVSNLTFVVATPAITLNPASLPAGAPVTITGTNFKVGSSVSFTINGNPLTVSPSVTTNGAGSFVTTFTVPDLIQGAGTVKAYSNDNLYAIATLTVATPVITLVPSTTSPGVPVTITGTNFKANSPITITLNSTTLSVSPSAVTNELGGFVTVFTVPDILQGAATVKAYAYDNLAGTAALTISAPTIVVTPTVVTPGTQMNIVGTNFKANANINLFFNGDTLSTTSGNTYVTTNSQGGFAVSAEVPRAPSTYSPVSTATFSYSVVKAEAYTNFFASTTITMQPAAFAITPSSGPDGIEVFANGTGFEGNKKVKFYFNNKELDLDEEVRTNVTGAFSTTLEIPKGISTGVFTLRAETGSLNYSNATYTVSATSTTFNSTSGSPGTKVSVTGTNFDPEEAVHIAWNGNEIGFVRGDVETSESGSFFATFIVPVDYLPGINQVEIWTSVVNKNLTNFTVAAPTLTLSPANAGPGATVNVTGANFEGGSKITLLWDDAFIQTSPREVISTLGGGFVTNIVLPNTSRGTHYVTATSENSQIRANTTYVVAAPSITTPVSSTQAGTKLTIYGSSFTANALVTFLWDNLPETSLAPAEVKTDNAGTYIVEITIPNGTSPGIHTLLAKTSEFVYGTLNLTVVSGIINTSRESGVANANLQITGNGFQADADLQFSWDGQKLDKTTRTDGIGGFSTDLLVPISQPGKHTIKAFTDDFHMAEVTYFIEEPQTTLDPQTPKSGEEVNVTGKNFVANAEVGIFVNGKKVRTDPENLIADGTGNFSAKFKVPFSIGKEIKIEVRSLNENGDVLGASTRSSSRQMSLLTATLIYGLLIGTMYVVVRLYWRRLLAKIQAETDI